MVGEVKDAVGHRNRPDAVQSHYWWVSCVKYTFVEVVNMSRQHWEFLFLGFFLWSIFFGYILRVISYHNHLAVEIRIAILHFFIFD